MCREQRANRSFLSSDIAASAKEMAIEGTFELSAELGDVQKNMEAQVTFEGSIN